MHLYIKSPQKGKILPISIFQNICRHAEMVAVLFASLYWCIQCQKWLLV